MALWFLVLILNAQAQLTESEYHQATYEVLHSYQEYFKKLGQTFVSMGNWKTKNNAKYAHPGIYKNHKSINVSGAMARTKKLNYDSFILILCHEVGHISDAAPLADGSAYEGQADYFSTLHCFKRLYRDKDNKQYYEKHAKKISPTAKELCRTVYPQDKDFYLCARGIHVSYQLIKAMNRKEKVSLDKKETETKWAYDWPFDHPSAQCRLDTLVAGLLCPKYGDKFSKKDYKTGTCIEEKYTLGIRPTCWFDPHFHEEIIKNK